MSRMWLLLLLGSLIALLAFLLFRNDLRILNPKYLQLKDAIRAQRKLYGFPEFFDKLILAQAYHETGILRSLLFDKHNNAFGMKYPRKRSTTAIGGTGTDENDLGYARYASVEDSVRDLFLWFAYVGFPKIPEPGSTPQNWYVGQLKLKNYFEDSFINYLRGVNNALDLIG